jgi:hypothetical protein
VNLRDRLAAAHEERRRAAGLPPVDDTPRSSPAGHQGPGPGDRATYGIDLDHLVDLRHPAPGSAPVIDLRPVAPAGDARAAAPPVGTQGPSFSAALAVSTETTCPRCGAEGTCNMEDVVGGVDHYSCTYCGHLYQVAR